MKWKKFLELRERHPYLVHDLHWRGVLRSHKEFVRRKVGFIAFRPFEKLDLTAKAGVAEITSLKSEYKFVEMHTWKSVDYNLVFHVQDEPESSRLRYIGPDVGDGSIQAHIDDIMTWFAGCEVFRGKQLIWERVVKRTVSGSSYSGLTEMNLEIYRFPPRYLFKQMPRESLPPLDPADVAYATGAKMPPIVPRLR